MDSILTSIKKMLGIEEDNEHFDPDVTMHINSVLMILSQLGIGPRNGFAIRDKNSKWTDFEHNETKVEAIRSFVYLKVRLLFDPPNSNAVIESMNNMANELEWRLNTAAEICDE